MKEKYSFLKRYRKIKYDEKSNTLYLFPQSKLWGLIGVIIGIMLMSLFFQDTNELIVKIFSIILFILGLFFIVVSLPGLNSSVSYEFNKQRRKFKEIHSYIFPKRNIIKEKDFNEIDYLEISIIPDPTDVSLTLMKKNGEEIRFYSALLIKGITEDMVYDLTLFLSEFFKVKFKIKFLTFFSSIAQRDLKKHFPRLIKDKMYIG